MDKTTKTKCILCKKAHSPATLDTFNTCKKETGQARNRTWDLVHAKHTRYQLRHMPLMKLQDLDNIIMSETQNKKIPLRTARSTRWRKLMRRAGRSERKIPDRAVSRSRQACRAVQQGDRCALLDYYSRVALLLLPRRSVQWRVHVTILFLLL